MADLNEVQQFITDNQDNDEVKEYVSGLNPINVDKLQTFINENEDGKKFIDSLKDKHFSKSLETWKSNNLNKLVDEEVNKRFPKADPKDVELQSIKAQLDQLKAEKAHETLLNKATKIANEKHLPLNLIDYFVGSDQDSTNNNLSKLEEVWNTSLTSAIEAKLKDSSYTPPANNNTTKTFTTEQMKNMTPEQINQNWDAINNSLKQ
ncbi:DUF4355 domain-containing protein [Sporolactobacillus laevolacticus]|uniref:DUF4355 domain-containing protein n=1 Tax=Sporolactobacillus laevolacticus TaxID=33018 RepID=UPI0025B4C65D|nr:DUF4355 domain-containing protein [Sporolactobacillus laevolacticus]MDN3956192.1 DUF4355 domain-containing protein [Sporolactobacillus laevolacticus]